MQRTAGCALGVSTEDTPSGLFGLQFRGPFFVFTWNSLHKKEKKNQSVQSDFCTNDTKVPKSPLKNISGSVTIKTFLPLINVVFLDSWLSLADHQTRCSINYAWLDLNGFFTGRLGLVIREPAHVEQPCPLGRGITPVQRKPTLWHEENRGKHHFLLARIRLSV